MRGCACRWYYPASVGALVLGSRNPVPRDGMRMAVARAWVAMAGRPRAGQSRGHCWLGRRDVERVKLGSDRN